ncbi:MAG: GrpB family protein [Candidatus Promineifilaceae bacterium]|nr:GrpB family protein [Candidatus Promineifilaceae bacterium]
MANANKRHRPISDEPISAAAIGECQSLKGTVYLAPYDAQWPHLFAQLKDRVQEALGQNVLLLEHVGSTAVPGLAAKPIIDMVLAVADSSDEAAYVDALAKEGFVLRIREPDWCEHRLFKYGEPKANLHVFSKGCAEIERMLLFRDWLRAHDDERLLYEKTKRELAARTWQHTQAYAEAKTEVIKQILARARLLSESENRPPAGLADHRQC